MNIQDFLSRQQVPFQRLLHQPAPTSSRRANSVHTQGRQVAKTVLLKNTDGQFLIAVLPSDKKIDWSKLATTTGKSGWKLATEQQAGSVFSDCETGAWPPFGSLYGVPTLVDDSFRSDSRFWWKAITDTKITDCHFMTTCALPSQTRQRSVDKA